MSSINYTCIHVLIGNKPSETISKKFLYGPEEKCANKDQAILLAILFVWHCIGSNCDPWPYISGDNVEETKLSARRIRRETFVTHEYLSLPRMSLSTSRQHRV